VLPELAAITQAPRGWHIISAAAHLDEVQLGPVLAAPKHQALGRQAVAPGAPNLPPVVARNISKRASRKATAIQSGTPCLWAGALHQGARACLLVVRLQRGGRAVVDDAPDVGLVPPASGPRCGRACCRRRWPGWTRTGSTAGARAPGRARARASPPPPTPRPPPPTWSYSSWSARRPAGATSPACAARPRSRT